MSITSNYEHTGNPFPYTVDAADQKALTKGALYGFQATPQEENNCFFVITLLFCYMAAYVAISVAGLTGEHRMDTLLQVGIAGAWGGLATSCFLWHCTDFKEAVCMFKAGLGPYSRDLGLIAASRMGEMGVMLDCVEMKEIKAN